VDDFNWWEKSNPPSLYETTGANILNPKEMTVFKFGARHLGRKFTKYLRHGDIHLLYIILSSVLLYLNLFIFDNEFFDIGEMHNFFKLKLLNFNLLLI